MASRKKVRNLFYFSVHVSTCPVCYPFNKNKINIQNISPVFWFITVRPEPQCSDSQNLLLVSQFSRGVLKSFCGEQFYLSASAQSKGGSEYGHIYDKYPPLLPFRNVGCLARAEDWKTVGVVS